MRTYAQMTKAELIQAIQAFEARETPRGRSVESVDPERERLLQELQVHQAELEMQNDELRRTQQQLEDSRNQYADLYDFAPVGYVTLDERGLIRQINMTGAALLGALRTHVIGKSFSRYVAPTEIPGWRDHLRQAFQQTEPLTTELHLNGATIPGPVVQLVSLARKDAATSALLIRSTLMDITARRQAEQAAAEHLQEVKFLSASATHLLESLPSAELFRYIAQQIHTVAGHALVLVTEYDAGANQARVQAMAGPDDKRSRLVPLVGQDPVGLTLTVTEGISERMNRGTLVKVEGGLYGLTFQQLPLSLCRAIEEQLELGESYAMPFVHGTDFLGTVALVTDRAEGLIHREVIELLVNQAGLALKRLHADDRIRELNRDLEHRMTEAEEANFELEAANRELAVAKQESEALVYSVSHDLHVPLVQIEQLASLLSQEYGPPLAEEGRQLVDLIRENARAARRLAQALLVLSRIEQQASHPQPVAVRGLVEHVLSELRTQEPGRQVEITLGDLPDAQADPDLLKQVWFHLLSNAFKFTRQQARARIEIGAREQEGHTVYSVKDNGAGFDMTNAGRLFRVFQRLHHAEDFPGEGLGLVIVDRIIRRHGGRVWAEAAMDQGATFYFWLS